jgi:hypothetical protein
MLRITKIYQIWFWTNLWWTDKLHLTLGTIKHGGDWVKGIFRPDY